MPVPPAPASAGMPCDFARVQVNGVIYSMTKGGPQFKSELTKATNSESAGWRQSIRGERECTGTVEAKLTAGLNPHIAPLNIYDGSLVYLEFFPVRGGSSYAGYAFLSDTKVDLTVPNEIPVSFSFTSEGAWTYPTNASWTYPPAP